MEFVTTVGIDRVKELEQNPELVQIDDLKLLAHHKGEKIFGANISKASSIDDRKEDEDKDHLHHGDIINLDEVKDNKPKLREMDSSKTVYVQNSEADTFVRDDDNLCTKIQKFVIMLLNMLFVDILFTLFIASQEVDDTSYLHALAMESRYETNTIIKGSIIAHLFINFVVILVSCLYSGFFLTQDDGHIMGCITIYFICAYEVLFHVMKWVDIYFDLKTTGS